jgi:hypothetical protein
MGEQGAQMFTGRRATPIAFNNSPVGVRIIIAHVHPSRESMASDRQGESSPADLQIKTGQPVFHECTFFPRTPTMRYPIPSSRVFARFAVGSRLSHRARKTAYMPFDFNSPSGRTKRSGKSVKRGQARRPGGALSYPLPNRS